MELNFLQEANLPNLLESLYSDMNLTTLLIFHEIPASKSHAKIVSSFCALNGSLQFKCLFHSMKQISYVEMKPTAVLVSSMLI